jgi:caffeoyl-CoA O-methyltransferase
MELVNALAEAYATKHTTRQNDLLNEIYDHTVQTHSHAHMISSQVQGSFLQMISELLQPKYILEIGTFTGYSALCLAAGLQNNGELHTIELREEDAMNAKGYFKRSKYADKINLHVGNAVEIIPTLEMTWDIIFIDADKTGYRTYYDLVMPRLRKNGIIIADNVLFHGQVLEEDISGKNAKAIHEFNEYVSKDERTEQVMLTLRDGLLLIKKIAE